MRLILTSVLVAGLTSAGVLAQQQLSPGGTGGGSGLSLENVLEGIAEEDETAPPPWAETEPRYQPQATVDQPFALVMALDKVTARVRQIGVAVGETGAFGTLSFTVRACRSTGDVRQPDNAVFLEVSDDPPGGDREDVFSGWMFSSSRAISFMSHPVYDLWLAGCVDEVPRPPEDFARDVEYTLPGNPPPPAPLPGFRGG
ncbi:MAG: DUF2155 domain-containing protein [Azospirillaceae bacterium]